VHRPQGTFYAFTEEDLVDNNDVNHDCGDDEDDSFLKGIGGAHKLLTGETYQRKLLQWYKEQQLSQFYS